MLGCMPKLQRPSLDEFLIAREILLTWLRWLADPEQGPITHGDIDPGSADRLRSALDVYTRYGNPLGELPNLDALRAFAAALKPTGDR